MRLGKRERAEARANYARSLRAGDLIAGPQGYATAWPMSVSENMKPRVRWDYKANNARSIFMKDKIARSKQG
jgi:hypothetical protein